MKWKSNDHWGSLSYLLAILWNSAFKWVYLSFCLIVPVSEMEIKWSLRKPFLSPCYSLELCIQMGISFLLSNSATVSEIEIKIQSFIWKLYWSSKVFSSSINHTFAKVFPLFLCSCVSHIHWLCLSFFVNTNQKCWHALLIL